MDPQKFWQKYNISKSTLVSRLENQNYDDVVKEIVYIINDKFPFMKYNMTEADVMKMFQNIVNYKAEFKTNRNSKLSTWNGPGFGNVKQTVTIVNQHGDYDKYNKLMEYFVEHIRMKARRSNQVESVLTWYKNHTKKIVKHCIKEYNEINAATIRESLYRLHYECTEFRITHLCAIIDLWHPKRILDFSAGRGARLMAAISRESQIEVYCGVDPDPAVHEVYPNMIKMFSKDPSKYRMIEGAFEETLEAIIDPTGEGFDLVFTSPPYFDLETYDDKEASNAKQSIVKFPTMNAWLEGFLFQSIRKAWKLLKPDGALAIVINDSPDLPRFIDRFVKVCDALPGSVNRGVTGYSGADSQTVQPIWVWQKQ